MSNSSHDLYVSNIYENAILPFYGSMVTRWRPLKCPLSFLDKIKGQSLTHILAQLQPSNPDDVDVITTVSVLISFYKAVRSIVGGMYYLSDILI